jgi:hypothetical protein
MGSANNDLEGGCCRVTDYEIEPQRKQQLANDQIYQWKYTRYMEQLKLRLLDATPEGLRPTKFTEERQACVDRILQCEAFVDELSRVQSADGDLPSR